MLNTYPLWKNLLILLIVTLGVIYALPNIYPPDSAIQISSTDSGNPVTKRIFATVNKVLDAEKISYFGTSLDEDKALIRFPNEEGQLRALSILGETLGDNYVIALNSAQTTPDWLRSIRAEPMKYGLDLMGGVHFLLEVNIEKSVKDRVASLKTEIKRNLRGEKLRYSSVEPIQTRGIRAVFVSEELRNSARTFLESQYREMQIIKGEENGFFIDLIFTEQGIKEIEDFAISQNVQTIRNRVNELGVSEPLVQRLGRNRIVVDLPGVQDTTKAKEILNKIATLEFYWEANANTPRSRIVEYDYEGRRVRVDKNIIIKGDRVVNARVGYDSQTGMPQVNITLDSDGGKIMNKTTGRNVGRGMAVLFIEVKSDTVEKMVDGEKIKTFVPRTEKRLISLANVKEPLGVQFRITGLEAGEAKDLALLLRAGALAAEMYFVEERTVGASLGAENIELGAISVSVGLGLVLLFMLIYYKVFGIAANIALMSNLVLLVAVMSGLSATLTLPGIAGIVLTVGMAVDANVLIFSRIKEELKGGLSPQAAINTGFDRAFVTIMDANLTTLLVALILYGIGTGPVKGFAVTLSIGIVTSMFTAIMGTRAIINLFYGRRSVEKLMI